MKEQDSPTGLENKNNDGSGNGLRRQDRRGKAFTRSELLLLVLHLIRLHPTHGYEVITSIRDYSQGVYRPSPGVIYPILATIEEEGYASIRETDGGKKQYSLTPFGQTYLSQQDTALSDTLQKMEKLVEGRAERDPLIVAAFEQLLFSLRRLTTNRSINTGERDAIIHALIEASEKIKKL